MLLLLFGQIFCFLLQYAIIVEKTVCELINILKHQEIMLCALKITGYFGLASMETKF